MYSGKWKGKGWVSEWTLIEKEKYWDRHERIWCTPLHHNLASQNWANVWNSKCIKQNPEIKRKEQDIIKYYLLDFLFETLYQSDFKLEVLFETLQTWNANFHSDLFHVWAFRCKSRHQFFVIHFSISIDFVSNVHKFTPGWFSWIMSPFDIWN